MPFEKSCIARHRKKANLTCKQCSVGYTFSLASMSGLEEVTSEITSLITDLAEWKPVSKKVSFIVRYAVFESCINAMEHGILGINKEEKTMLRNLLLDEYESYIEKELLEKAAPVNISLCVNPDRILIGIHDRGGGFDFNEKNFGSKENIGLLKTSGRGLSILKSLGFSLFWNRKGNSILCSFENPKPNTATETA